MSEKYPSPAKEPTETLWAPRPEQPEEPMPRDNTLEVVKDAPPRPMTAPEMIQAAIAAKLDPAALKAVTDWATDLADREAKRLFNVDMVKCQAVMPSIVNDAENPQTRSRYPKFETMLRTAKPIWVAHGFALAIVEATLNGDMLHYVGEVMHIAGHTKQVVGDIGLDGTGPKGGASSMNRPQATGSTRSYGMRYLVRDVFCLAFADEDDDAVNARTKLIGEKEIVSLNELWKQLDKAGWTREKNFGPWLKWLAIESMGDLTLERYKIAEKQLVDKLAKLKGGAK